MRQCCFLLCESQRTLWRPQGHIEQFSSKWSTLLFNILTSPHFSSNFPCLHNISSEQMHGKTFNNENGDVAKNKTFYHTLLLYTGEFNITILRGDSKAMNICMQRSRWRIIHYICDNSENTVLFSTVD